MGGGTRGLTILKRERGWKIETWSYQDLGRPRLEETLGVKERDSPDALSGQEKYRERREKRSSSEKQNPV